MYCKKCEKSLPEDSTFCPYCGNEQLEADAPAAEAVETEEVVENAGEEAVAEAVEPEVKGNGGKKGIVIGVLAVVIALLVATVAFLGVKLMGGNDTPAVTTDGASEGELFPEQYTAVYPDGIDYSTIKASEYVTLGQYKGLTVTVTTSSEITDADVETYINDLLANSTYKVEVLDRAAKNGDTVTLDYVGTLDGVAFNGGSATNAAITLGEGGYIPGFEEGIVGMTKGEVKTIDVTFPESYHNTDLAGKAVQFTFTVHKIEESVVPEYTDAFVRENFDFDTKPSFEAYVREVLLAQREEEITAEKHSGILTQITANASVIKYPEGLVEDYMFQQIDSARFTGAMYYGMEYSEFIPAALGISAYEYEQQVRKSAEDATKQELVLFAVFEDAGLSYSEEERAALVEQYLEDYEAEDVASFCESNQITEAFFNNMLNFLLTYDTTLEYLVENTTFVEK
ncbi:MAG: trigger factor [Clostridia bacterium]|nr:trigger factor [Clostridia bacterium]MBQ6614219.1 trigger factor [Clostridia bacterium]